MVVAVGVWAVTADKVLDAQSYARHVSGLRTHYITLAQANAELLHSADDSSAIT